MNTISVSKSSINAHSLSKKDLAVYFEMPIKVAAQEIGVCTTILKKICRKNGIPRWPYRKIQSLNKAIASLETQANREPSEGKLEKNIRALQEQKAQIITNPGLKRKRSISSDQKSNEDDEDYDSKPSSKRQKAQNSVGKEKGCSSPQYPSKSTPSTPPPVTTPLEIPTHMEIENPPKIAQISESPQNSSPVSPSSPHPQPPTPPQSPLRTSQPPEPQPKQEQRSPTQLPSQNSSDCSSKSQSSQEEQNEPEQLQTNSCNDENRFVGSDYWLYLCNSSHTYSTAMNYLNSFFPKILLPFDDDEIPRFMNDEYDWEVLGKDDPYTWELGKQFESCA